MRTHTGSDDLTQLLLKLDQSGDVDGSCRIAKQILDQFEAADYRASQVSNDARLHVVALDPLLT